MLNARMTKRLILELLLLKNSLILLLSVSGPADHALADAEACAVIAMQIL